MSVQNLSAKDYLSQAYRIDQRINSKIEQVQSLRDLAAKARPPPCLMCRQAKVHGTSTAWRMSL